MPDETLLPTEAPAETAATTPSESTQPDEPVDEAAEEPAEDFGEAFAEFERTHKRAAPNGDGKQLPGTVVSVDAEYVYLDVGFRSEGVLALSALPNGGEGITAGDKMLVSIKGRTPEGMLELSRIHVVQPTDWSSLEEAFAKKTPSAVW